MHPREPHAKRWKDEAAFFDGLAEKAGSGVGLIDPLALKRYSSPTLRRRFNKEFRFLIMNKIKGKTILDLGTGDGTNAILLAKLGAKVTGIDISPKAIATAKRRAEINGLAESTQFICSPIETATLPENSFDIIWGDAILHHLIEVLDLVIPRMSKWARPGALVIFAEPINFCNALRRIRHVLPVTTAVTPGERPLKRAEIDVIKRYIPDLKIRFFNLLGRLNQFILIDYNYERSPLIRKALANLICAIDYVPLSLPIIRSMGGTCVMYGYL